MYEFNGSNLVIKNTSGSSSHVFNLPTSHSHRKARETYKLTGKCDYLFLSMQACCYSSPRFCFEKISNLQKNFRENKINTQIFSSRFTFLSLSVPFSLSLSLSLSLWYLTISCRHHVIPNTMTTLGEFDLENTTIQMHAQLLSHVQLFANLWTVAHQPLVYRIFHARILE